MSVDGKFGDGRTPGRSQNHVGVFLRGRDGGDPSFVAFQGSKEPQLLSHFV